MTCRQEKRIIIDVSPGERIITDLSPAEIIITDVARRENNY